MNEGKRIINYVLKKNEIDKIELLRHINGRNPYTINELCSLISTPRTTVRRYLNELNSDLDFLTDGDAIITYNDTYQVEINYSHQKNGDLLALKIQLLYLKNSVYYQVLLHLILHKHVTIDSLVDTLAISKSYCYRAIQYLNEMFDNYQVDIHIDKINGYLQYVGKESQVRIFIFKFLHNYHQMIAWPFLDESRKAIQDANSFKFKDALKERSGATNMLVDYFQATISLRLSMNHHMLQPPKQIERVVEVFLKHSTLVHECFHATSKFRLSEDELYREKVFFLVVERIFIPNLEKKSTKKEIGRELYMVGDDPLTLYCKDFAHEFIAQFQLVVDEESKYQIFYYVVILFLTATVFSEKFISVVDVVKMNDNSYISKKDISEISTFYETYVREHPSDIFPYPILDYRNYANNVLYLLKKTHMKASVKVFVEYSKISNGTLALRGVIEDYFSNHTLQITEVVEEADIIISDYIGNIDSSKFHYHLNDIFSLKEIQDMFHFMNEILMVLYLEEGKT